ncbi:hypothetical protein DNH61_03235 [Paenibacillus sambharensis]|uniref:DUF421 domain-containing protein n=1 Tax=Paenibacillus sambharensis TaxID=1803190 RepID=A0A2W1LSB3_9BACL|nr:DUF421 domain-containing protein [Paenibacillus sambharensis]PZD97374.1 hypothetical protein DNH61_03235 [Paenibacillus sambharensis]
MEWSQLFIRIVLTYLFLMLFSRLVGKKIISQMTFFDFIAGVTFGSLGGTIILTDKVPLIQGLAALAGFSVLAIGTDWLTLKSRLLRKWFNGKEDLLIINGVIDRKALEKSRVTMDDLLMQLRKKNVFYLDEISFAFLEKDGTVTVQKKGALLPVTVQDMSLNSMERGVPRLLYMDGSLADEPSKSPIKPDITVDMIREQYGDEIDPKEILIAQADQNGRIFVARGDERDKMNRNP